jgi:two-component system chemotaxis response regulator CheY
MKALVLMVDDSAPVRRMLHAVLSAAGFEVAEAEDGLDALSRLADIRPDVILTDINMPRLDGLGFIEQARTTANGEKTPIVVLSSETRGKLLRRAEAAGVCAWLNKPSSPGVIVAALMQARAAA